MDNNLKLEVNKHYPVTKEKLFAAWTDEEQLKQWWKPMSHSLVEVTSDMKQGGEVKYVFDSGLIISGNYEEVSQNEKLAYSWNWNFPKDEIKNAAFKLTVTFSSDGNGSNLHIIQANFESEEAILPHKEGWEKELDNLAQLLNDQKD